MRRFTKAYYLLPTLQTKEKSFRLFRQPWKNTLYIGGYHTLKVFSFATVLIIYSLVIFKSCWFPTAKQDDWCTYQLMLFQISLNGHTTIRYYLYLLPTKNITYINRLKIFEIWLLGSRTVERYEVLLLQEKNISLLFLFFIFPISSMYWSNIWIMNSVSYKCMMILEDWMTSNMQKLCCFTPFLRNKGCNKILKEKRRSFNFFLPDYNNETNYNN